MEQPKRTPGRPRQKGSDTPSPDAILMQAAAMFSELGYEGVSLDGVAKQCGVTKATIYYYFSNKANLFTAAMCQIMQFAAATTQRYLEEERPLQERLHRVIVGHLRATANLQEFEGHMRRAEPQLSTEQLSRIHEAKTGIYLPLVQEFAAASERQEIAALDPWFAAHSFSALLATGHLRRPDGSPLFATFDEAADRILQLFFAGIAHREA